MEGNKINPRVRTSSDSLLESLTSDLRLLGLSPSSDDEAIIQFWRRTHIRTFFAFVEGVTWLHKQYCLMLNKHGRADFTTGELVLLREVQFNFQDGQVREQLRFLNVADNYRFAFYALTKTVRSKHVLDASGEVWHGFKKAIEIRNRITHPKGSADLLVSAEEDLLIHKVAVSIVGELLVLNVALHKWMEENRVPFEELDLASAEEVESTPPESTDTTTRGK